MRVLITGGAGFIGSHLAERLLKSGDEVLVIDNYETGRRDNLKPQERLTIVEGNICDTALMRKTFEGFKPEVVMHAAASYKDPDNFIGDAATNAHGTAVVVQEAKRVGVKRLLYCQTALCYGNPKTAPITLDHPLDPSLSSYAISKTAGEMYIALSGLEWQSFRLANAYGPRNLSGPLPTFFSRLTTGKACFVAETRRDFIYIDDMIDVMEKAVKGKGKSGAYHISTGGDVPIKDLFDATIAALNIKLDKPVEVRPRNPDDVETIFLDPSKTEKDFEWKASMSLTEGIRRTIGYYRDFGITQTFTHLRLDEKK